MNRKQYFFRLMVQEERDLEEMHKKFDETSGVTAADNETARAKPTPRVEARLLAKARGLDGDDTNTINERLSNGND